MFSFLKKKEDPTNEVPAWASFFTAKEYSVFMKHVDSYFHKLNVEYIIEDGAVSVGENSYGFALLGLHNIAQMCKQADLKNYGDLIADHFNSMSRINLFQKEFDDMAADFEKVGKYIAVRLFDTEYVSHLEEENRVTRNFAEDIVAMLVFDQPDSIVNIKPEQIVPWGKTVDELFEIGRGNVKNSYPVNVKEEKVGDHMIWFVMADHSYVSSFVFDIADYPQVVGSYGSLVSIPNRHTVLAYPIDSLEVLGALNGMLYLTSRMYEDGPGSITDKLYWYKDGQIINLPHRREDGKLIFAPPQIFVDVLNLMGETKSE